MDETTEHKVRDLKLKIMKTEKELTATQHTMNLGAWLGAGRAAQMHRSAEKDRVRLEAKLAELKSKLEELAPGSAASPANAEAPDAPAKEKAVAKKTTARKSSRK